MDNQASKLPPLKIFRWKNFKQNVLPIAFFSVYFLFLALSRILFTDLVSYLLIFLGAPSAVFSALQYAYSEDQSDFYNIYKVFIFWKHYFYDMLVPSCLFLLSVILVEKGLFYCLSALVVLAGINLINAVVNVYDETVFNQK